MGLVINRPSSIAVDTAMLKLQDSQISSDPIYAGGPVETSALFILHSCTELGSKDEQVTDGVFVTGSNESFELLIANEKSCSHHCGFRIYCGYAGWGAGQLQGEIARGDWQTLSADVDLVFEDDPYNVWDTCMQQIQERNRVLPHTVRNPEWN